MKSPLKSYCTRESSLQKDENSGNNHNSFYFHIQEYNLFVSVIGTPDTPARNIIAAPGGVVGFECYSPDTAPLPVVLWFRNSVRIRSGGNVFISPITNNLIIRNLTEDDGGIIHCKIRNLAGERRFDRGFLIIGENSKYYDVSSLDSGKKNTLLFNEVSCINK